MVATEPAPPRPFSEEVVAEERAELVASEHAEFAGAVGEGDRQAVGVGVVREDDVGTDARAARRGRGRALPAPRGSGRRRSGSPDRVRPAVRPRAGRIEARTDEELREDRTPDAVERRVDDPEPARPVRVEDRRDRRGRVGARAARSRRGARSGRVLTGRRARRAPVTARARRRASAIRVSSGRDDLRTVSGVGLVAVVGRRVVARGDHHARGGPEVTDGERGERGGERSRQKDGRARPPPLRRRPTSAAKIADPWRASRPTTMPASARFVALVCDPARRPRPSSRARRHGSSAPGQRRARRAARRSRRRAAGRNGPAVAASSPEPEQSLELGTGRRVWVAGDPGAEPRRRGRGKAPTRLGQPAFAVVTTVRRTRRSVGREPGQRRRRPRAPRRGRSARG